MEHYASVELWKGFVDQLPYLIWGVLVLLLLFLLMKYVIKPIIDGWHEKKLYEQRCRQEDKLQQEAYRKKLFDLWVSDQEKFTLDKLKQGLNGVLDESNQYKRKLDDFNELKQKFDKALKDFSQKMQSE